MFCHLSLNHYILSNLDLYISIPRLKTYRYFLILSSFDHAILNACMEKCEVENVFAIITTAVRVYLGMTSFIRVSLSGRSFDL